MGRKERFVIAISKNIWLRVFLAAIPLAVCMGQYGSYASVALTLVIWGCAVMLTEGKSVKRGMEMKYMNSRSIARRIIGRIEMCEGYEGTENVVLVGHIMDTDYFYNPWKGTYWTKQINGLGVAAESTSFSHIGITPLFFNQVMGYSRPVSIYNAADFSEDENLLISQMDIYPKGNCVQKIGDTVVVKFSDTE